MNCEESVSVFPSRISRCWIKGDQSQTGGNWFYFTTTAVISSHISTLKSTKSIFLRFLRKVSKSEWWTYSENSIYCRFYFKAMFSNFHRIGYWGTHKRPQRVDSPMLCEVVRKFWLSKFAYRKSIVNFGLHWKEVRITNCPYSHTITF